MCVCCVCACGFHKVYKWPNLEVSSNGYGWGPIPPSPHGWSMKVLGAVNNMKCAEGLTINW